MKSIERILTELYRDRVTETNKPNRGEAISFDGREIKNATVDPSNHASKHEKGGEDELTSFGETTHDSVDTTLLSGADLDAAGSGEALVANGDGTLGTSAAGSSPGYPQDVLSNRQEGTFYTNNTGGPLWVSATVSDSETSGNIPVASAIFYWENPDTQNNHNLAENEMAGADGGQADANVQAVVPDGTSYSVYALSGSLSNWYEQER